MTKTVCNRNLTTWAIFGKQSPIACYGEMSGGNISRSCTDERRRSVSVKPWHWQGPELFAC